MRDIRQVDGAALFLDKRAQPYGQLGSVFVR